MLWSHFRKPVVLIFFISFRSSTKLYKFIQTESTIATCAHYAIQMIARKVNIKKSKNI